MEQPTLIRQASLANIRRLGGDELLYKMIDLFLDNTPPRLEALRNAQAAGNLKAMSLEAHALKSSAGNFGALPMMDLAGRIEQLASEGGSEELPELVGHLQARFEQVRDRLAQERTSSGS
jgi:HPt (histidine-containing phosphotransfer) domain-containing protein